MTLVIILLKNPFYLLLRFIPKPLVKFARTVKRIVNGDFFDAFLKLEEKEFEIPLNAGSVFQRYENLPGTYRFEHTINNYEAKIFSQHGEDGILLYIYSQIGAKNRRFVEFGIGNGKQCNSANLSINFGWRGLLMEADPGNVAAAKSYYEQELGKKSDNIRILQAFVTRENINDLLEENGASGEIDLLSIDIDGNDYWVWSRINVIQPRVVVIEYNASFGAHRSISIPYNPHFELSKAHPSGFYHGASLVALVKLGIEKEYAFVGCDSSGVNAFFVHNSACHGKFQIQNPEESFFPHRKRTARFSLEQQYSMIADLGFAEI